ncbi:MAG: glycoside hydrolase family 43 protein [Oscillospiraceae bacterium]|nr:glycoside hydrolase family 43 protein [Oscillospiraceae bacterium]
MTNDNNMKAYLFVHFMGTESDEQSEQIYFSVSEDGTEWRTLNGGKPVLVSDKGECGVRDPHIIRSPEGDKYFLIATDLSIYNRRNDERRWDSCQTSGSRSMVVWESDDLAVWSESRLVKIAPDNAGCAWAPESVYDDETGRYMVFWASKTADDNYSVQRIYRSYTEDFRTFTKPEIYIDGGNISNIDTTIIKDKGIYYRFTKNESKSSIIMEKSRTLAGGFEAVSEYEIDGSPGNTVTGYEGPTIYKINGENRWCLMLDYFSKKGGYKPFITDDLKRGIFRSAEEVHFDGIYRHGTVMPVTKKEYNTLIDTFR